MKHTLNIALLQLAPCGTLQENLRNNVMNQIVIPQLKDNIHAWVMNSDGSYTKLQPKKDETVYDSQEEIAKKLNLMKK